MQEVYTDAYFIFCLWQIRDGQSNCYVLKNKDLEQAFKGVIYLELDLIYNPVSLRGSDRPDLCTYNKSWLAMKYWNQGKMFQIFPVRKQEELFWISE